MIILHKKTIDKIIEFWEKERPYVIGPIRLCKFYKHAAIEVVVDFLNNDEKDDIENYPWSNKIFEKRKEMFGF